MQARPGQPPSAIECKPRQHKVGSAAPRMAVAPAADGVTSGRATGREAAELSPASAVGSAARPPAPNQRPVRRTRRPSEPSSTDPRTRDDVGIDVREPVEHIVSVAPLAGYNVQSQAPYHLATPHWTSQIRARLTASCAPPSAVSG